VGQLDGKVAWITGAGSGIGKAAAIALAGEGAIVVLSGRRRQPLVQLAAQLESLGATALVRAGDVTRAKSAQSTVDAIVAKYRRLDILVNNAGVNIPKRNWRDLTPDGADSVLQTNLSGAFYCVLAALPVMREQRDGVLIHVSSWAGRFVGPLTGPAYIASKHGLVAMSHSINCEECINGIRSTAICPGEVATPILDKRPVPVTKAQRSRMLQPEDLGDFIRYVACLPRHMCVNEILVSPTLNRNYVAALKRAGVRP
jgi:NAD(P)-dependent dehydrogenase (short-subunit alcohol dehydrogenase family)